MPWKCVPGRVGLVHCLGEFALTPEGQQGATVEVQQSKGVTHLATGQAQPV